MRRALEEPACGLWMARHEFAPREELPCLRQRERRGEPPERFLGGGLTARAVFDVPGDQRRGFG